MNFSMQPPILLYVVACAGYACAALVEWRAFAVPDLRGGAMLRTERLALPLVFIVHAVLVVRAVLTPQGIDLSLANAVSAVACVTAVVAWLGALSRGVPGVTGILLPIAAIAALLPALFRNPHRYTFGEAPLAALHIGVALVAYALLIVAALQALLLIGFERRLHAGRPGAGSAAMPPLLTLEALTFRVLGLGFALLTATLASGILFSEEVFGKPLTFTHKVVFSMLSWVVFGALLFGRHRYGWRGRAALQWLVAGTVLLVLAYLGSKFVLEVLLGR